MHWTEIIIVLAIASFMWTCIAIAAGYYYNNYIAYYENKLHNVKG